MFKKGFAALLLLIILGALATGSFFIAYKTKYKNPVENIGNKFSDTNVDQVVTSTVTPINKQVETNNQPTQIMNNYKSTTGSKVYPSTTATLAATATLTPTPTPTHAPSNTLSPTPTEKKGGKPTSSAPSTGG